MASSYNIAEYLLDRAEIEDVVTKMYLYVDQRAFKNLFPGVFAEQVEMDYTDLLGGAPFSTTGQKQAESWEAQMSGYSSTQHGIIGTVVNLPSPGSGNNTPNTATAIANVTATLVSPNGSIVRNGGRLHLDVQRTRTKENTDRWLISGMKAYKCWMDGDFETSALKQQAD